MENKPNDTPPGTGPQPENGTTAIAHEIVEALCRTNLSPYETRFLWCVFRKTYGWHKKEDWISLSQIVEITGMHKSHVSRTKKRLLGRGIVTQAGNKIAFNKFYTQWRELPERVTGVGTGEATPEELAKIGLEMRPSDDRGDEVTSPGTPPVQVTTPPPAEAHTNTTSTNTILNKDEWLPDQVTSLERRFQETVVRECWCDEAYAEKTWGQSRLLRAGNRNEFYRKVTLMLTWSKLQKHRPRAKTLFHEIAGFVSDRGQMERVLDDKELAERRAFAEAENGQSVI